MERKSLLILHCYGVYHRGDFYTEHPETTDVYRVQLQKSFDLLNNGSYDVLIISGGYTKPQVEKSEARGMVDWAENLGLLRRKKDAVILLEEYAKDSLENLLFSMCRFFQFFGKFPYSVASCTWRFNAERFQIFARKLLLPRYEVIAVGTQPDEEKIARKWAEFAERDPFYVKQLDSRKKYLARDPWKKQHPYGQINENFRLFFEKIAEIKEGKGDVEKAQFLLPWKNP